MDLHVRDDALQELRAVFIAVEGDCEPWTDAEIVRRTLVRGAMEYGRAAGRPWKEIEALADAVRSGLS